MRAVVEHARRFRSVDFDHPIILNEREEIVDGGHRICKALLEGIPTVKAVRLTESPEPDLIEDV